MRANHGQIESLKQSATRGLGLRVIVGGAVGFVSSTDLRDEAITDLARRAVALAGFSTPDEANALPEKDEAAEPRPEDLALYDPEVLALSTDRKIEMALALERLALAHDPRITRSEGAGVTTRDGAVLIANSHGLARGWSGTAISMYVIALADDRDGKQQTGAYGVGKRWVRDLPTVESVADEAGRRAVSRLGARTVPSAKVPVVMHPDIAAAWLSEMYDAFAGDSVLKRSSWLTERLGQEIASPIVTLVDDGRLRAGVGTSPFDGEGVATRRNVLIDRGTCAMFTYDTYTARRVGTRSTGNAQRSFGSVPAIGYNNLYVEAGAASPDSIVATLERGFYMDDQGSFGFNDVTGDYSYQAQGFWIENGKKSFPVEGVTVASNSLDMLRSIVAVGDDLKFDDAVACPTLLIGEMTVSGSG